MRELCSRILHKRPNILLKIKPKGFKTRNSLLKITSIPFRKITIVFIYFIFFWTSVENFFNRKIQVGYLQPQKVRQSFEWQSLHCELV